MLLRVDINRVFNDTSLIYEVKGRVDTYLEVDGDLILCYDLHDIPDSIYMRLSLSEIRATIVRIDSTGKEKWRISPLPTGEYKYIYIDNDGKYRAATSGYEIYYFDPETGKTQGWDYE